MTLLLVNRRKEVLVTGMKAKACNMFNVQFSQFLPRRFISVTFTRRSAKQNYHPHLRGKKMDPFILRYLTCPILPRKLMSKPELGGLSPQGLSGSYLNI